MPSTPRSCRNLSTLPRRPVAVLDRRPRSALRTNSDDPAGVLRALHKAPGAGRYPRPLPQATTTSRRPSRRAAGRQSGLQAQRRPADQCVPGGRKLARPLFDGFDLVDPGVDLGCHVGHKTSLTTLTTTRNSAVFIGRIEHLDQLTQAPTGTYWQRTRPGLATFAHAWAKAVRRRPATCR